MKNYEMIPFAVELETLVKRNLSKEVIDEYFFWLQNNFEDRTDWFAKKILGIVEPKFSKIELESLFYFLKDNIQSRTKSALELSEERDSLPEHLKNIHRIDSYVLLPESVSLIIDYGLFFARCMLREFPDLTWTLKTDQFADYAEVCLYFEGGKRLFGPVTIARNTVHQILSERANEDTIGRNYNYWLETLKRAQK